MFAINVSLFFATTVVCEWPTIKPKYNLFASWETFCEISTQLSMCSIASFCLRDSRRSPISAAFARIQLILLLRVKIAHEQALRLKRTLWRDFSSTCDDMEKIHWMPINYKKWNFLGCTSVEVGMNFHCASSSHIAPLLPEAFFGLAILRSNQRQR